MAYRLGYNEASGEVPHTVEGRGQHCSRHEVWRERHSHEAVHGAVLQRREHEERKPEEARCAPYMLMSAVVSLHVFILMYLCPLQHCKLVK